MSFNKSGLFALLWLAFAALGIASPVLYNSPGLTVTGQPLGVNGGGQFQGNLNGGSIFKFYCVDYNNLLVSPSAVYVSDAGDLASRTRYGATATGSFATLPGLLVQPTLTAENRYVMAGWLTTNYNIAAGNSDPNNVGIQNAIWDLLHVASRPGAASSGTGNETAWLNNAITFEGNASQYNTIKSQLRVMTDVRVTSSEDRYHSGSQEMVYLTNAVPEPATYGLIGAGMILLALLRRKRIA